MGPQRMGLGWCQPIFTNKFLNLPKLDLPVGGRLFHFYDFWKQLTHDLTILQIITGLHLDVDSDVPQWDHAPQLIFSDDEICAADAEIQSLLVKNAIVPCSDSEPGQFMNNIFLVPKLNSEVKFCTILNLKKFNFYISKIKFHMETFNSMLDLVQSNSWLTKIDLSDAYLVIKIFGPHTKFFEIQVEPPGVQICCNGLWTFVRAPRVFTKLLKVPPSWLRRLGFLVAMYLDDSLQVSQTYKRCLRTTQATYNMLVSCGFLPNAK